MDYGQFSALLVLIGAVLLGVTANEVSNGSTNWKRSVGYFGAGVFFFGLVSCVAVAAGLSISIS